MSDNQNKLLTVAKQVMQNAYCPYSKFKVGAAILAENGEIFSGCNVENASFSVTLCAEAVAIGKMISAGAQKVKEILVIADADKVCTPCGACRQRINEFSDEITLVHVCDKHGVKKTVPFSELLPCSFGAKNIE